MTVINHPVSPEPRDRVGWVLGWLAVWLIVCSAAAVPSFHIASQSGYDNAGMAVGVLAFVLAYTAFTSTRRFALRFERDAALRRTMYIGYGLRSLLALAFPIAGLVDMIPGMVSVQIVRQTGLGPKGFEAALLTTLIQGVFLNAILGLFMAGVYLIARRWMAPPPEARGFMVVPLAECRPGEPPDGAPTGAPPGRRDPAS